MYFFFVDIVFNSRGRFKSLPAIKGPLILEDLPIIEYSLEGTMRET